jgi:hypothetical protein
VKVNPITRRDLLALLVVVLAAAVVRLGEIDIVPFLYDQALLSQLAQDTASLKSIPLLGLPTSVGIPAPATSIYVMALPYLISDSPVFATAFVAVLNIGGVALLWLIGHRYFSRLVGLVGGLVYALNLWAILYSRTIWTPDLHTPFILLAFWVGCLGFIEGKRWARITCLPLFMFAAQVYMWALPLAPAFTLLVWLGRRQVTRPAALREWGLSLAITLLLMLPYAIGVVQGGLIAAGDFLASRQERNIHLDSKALAIAGQFVTSIGVEPHIVGDAMVADLWAAIPSPAPIWVIILGGFTVLGIVGVWWRYRSWAGILTLWALSMLIMLTPTWTDIYPQYFVPLLPIFALWAGVGVETFILRLPGTRFSRAVAAVGLGAVFATQILAWFVMLNYTKSHYPTSSAFGTVLQDVIPVRDELAQYRQVVVVTNDYWTQYDQEPMVWRALLHGSVTCLRAIGGNSFAVFPIEPFAVLTTPRAPKSPANNVYVTYASEIFPARSGEGQYTVSFFEKAPDWNGPILIPIAPVTFESGAQLIGYALEPGLLLLEWSITRDDGGDYQYFGHFLGAAGERIGQRDTTFLPGGYWCEGDRIITWIDIALPEASQTLRVGMYAVGQGQLSGQIYASNVVDAAGNAAGQWVDIPLIE